jgi:hypothetical protein
MSTRGAGVRTVDVNVASFERIDTSARIHRILILKRLDDSILRVRTIAITTKIIKIKPISLSRLASDNTHPLNITARELARQNLKRTGSQILIRTIKFLLLKRHEEIHN